MRTWMPAEWVRHEATLLTWPHDATIWEDLHEDAMRTFGELAARLSRVERVDLAVHDDAADQAARAALREADACEANVRLLRLPADDVWARDHGPLIVYREHRDLTRSREAVAFRFNAWGGKFAHSRDALLSAGFAANLQLPYHRYPLVAEGGALEVNGAGHLLTTESVLLRPTRNPGWAAPAVEQLLGDALGVTQVTWLVEGLEGDDTDGHIDDIARFVDERTIVAVAPPPGHPDHEVMAENWERLRAARDAAGEPFRLVPLPVPQPLSHRGCPCPASYANFYIANGLVLVPTFGQPTDAEALDVLARLFPRHRVEGLDSSTLITQSGAIHCVTQQVPIAP